ncbi:tetratricopeptide repeat protein [Chitinophaga ginsengisoli]|uniref:Tetratricopeptide repeat protein n=1 Tax=Chitinophaga ginsengisoli TaxID=363837 RepID=A0A2P8FZ70_9BACT|nr:tetratricopeptide repeat protein [Chitinophaga ginsengisoli]
MVSSRLINNDDEYIDGLLDSSPAIVDAIYKRFARKVKHMVTGWGGNIKEAANVFEDVIMAIYDYAHLHKLTLTNHFEPFFLYACQLKWKQDLMQKEPGKAMSFHPVAPAPGLDEQHIRYIEAALAAPHPHVRQGADNTREELEEIIADQRERWFHTKDGPNRKVSIYVIITAIIGAGLAGLLFVSPWHKDIYRQFSGTEMVHAHHQPTEQDTALLMHQAAAAFNHGHFNKAIGLLNQIIVRDSLNTTARYYRGISLVDEGNLAEARKDLQTVFNSHSPFRYDAAFYMALSYIRERDKQQCLEWVLKIPENAPIYWKAARLKEEISY